jgi:hypothetical protein
MKMQDGIAFAPVWHKHVEFFYEFSRLDTQSFRNVRIFRQFPADCGQIAQNHHFYVILRLVRGHLPLQEWMLPLPWR